MTVAVIAAAPSNPDPANVPTAAEKANARDHLGCNPCRTLVVRHHGGDRHKGCRPQGDQGVGPKPGPALPVLALDPDDRAESNRQDNTYAEVQ